MAIYKRCRSCCACPKCECGFRPGQRPDFISVTLSPNSCSVCGLTGTTGYPPTLPYMGNCKWGSLTASPNFCNFNITAPEFVTITGGNVQQGHSSTITVSINFAAGGNGTSVTTTTSSCLTGGVTIPLPFCDVRSATINFGFGVAPLLRKTNNGIKLRLSEFLRRREILQNSRRAVIRHHKYNLDSVGLPSGGPLNQPLLDPPKDCDCDTK